MKTKATTKHPILDLEINEDGTQMWYQGREITVKTYKNDRDNYPFKRVAFANKTHSVAKLVCEAWNGLREEMWQVVCRKDKDPTNDHYTNLYWGKRGKVRTARYKRDHRSKITPTEIPTVVNRINNGETMTNIAKSYNTSSQSILRIKNRLIRDKTLKLKDAIMQAKTTHARHQAYANYMGYKTVSDAINARGTKGFKTEIDNLATTL